MKLGSLSIMAVFLMLVVACSASFVWANRKVAPQCAAGAGDADTDGDGLPDFQEIHKYRTDPGKKDTAGAGVADGDWAQRRQFTYSVRAVVRVMPPYNLAAMNDDYQDVRVLAQNKDYVELEVIAYPLNSNDANIPGNPTWKTDYAGMKEFLEPGITTNWDAQMRKDLLQDLSASGIDPDKLSDKEVVEQVSRWLFRRSKYRYMFCTQFVHFPGGKPAVYPGLEGAFQREKGDKGWSDPEQFAHELLGKEMFYRKTHGTCTSSAIYQAAVLRALGIPTRIILAIPLVDASDPAQVALAQKGLTHNQVRTTATFGLLAAGQSFTSHTFLEVYVGRRWRRLNYTRLGQNILDSQCLGLMIHVHTFRDLSEANLAATWGLRYGLGKREGVFQHNNPYQTLAVEDSFGRFAKVPNPPASKEHKQITIGNIYWHDSEKSPDATRELKSNASPGSGRFFVHGEEWFEDAGDYLQYKLFLTRADGNFVLRAPRHPDVKCRYSGGFVTLASQQVREMEVVIPPEELAHMATGVPYTLQPVNAVTDYRWQVRDGLTLVRQPSLAEKVENLQKRVDKLAKRLLELETKGKP
jgi:hypothetical protein